MNLKCSLVAAKSHLTVAGIYPSFFNTIGIVIALPNLTLPNLTTGVRSSNQSFGFSNFKVGNAPSPLKSNNNLCVLGDCSPFSTMASNIP